MKLIDYKGRFIFMPKPLDLTNQIFGNLKAIKKAPSRSGKTYWECECLLCGTHKEVQTCHLTGNKITSCGQHTNKADNFGKCSEKIFCAICGKEFISNNYARRYCYDCSPSGLSPTDRLRHNKRALKHFLLEYKGGTKCSKCGYDKCEGALQFHHLNPKEKDFRLLK